ncbi:aldo/keto reductase [Cohnella sp. 56]|uniref:aldo/keto reductase n=1 Tax=Cohnella sp. 56 TaxID=3113722 RepID=UPI0030E79F24
MQYRNLGRSGLRVSAIGLGTNAFGKRADKETSIRIVHEALDSGINMLDTANIYAGTLSESIIGEALAGRRQEAVLATKAGLPMGQGPNDRGSSRFHLQRELEGSLRRLKTDYVDLYQIHTFDPGTPLEETLRTLDDFVSAGKVRYIGASNYAAWELMKAIGVSDRYGYARFICTQASYSLADRTPEAELIPLCIDQGVGLIPYFPLAGGILTGKYATAGDPAPEGSRANTDPTFRRFLGGRADELGRELSALADELGVEPAVLAIAWLLARPAVATVIAGATRPGQLRANLAADALILSEDTLARLDRISDDFRHGDPFAVYRLS